MSYSEEIKSKSLEVFKSVPWGNKPGAVVNTDTAPSTTPSTSEDSANINTSEFTDQTVTAFRDNVNWLGSSNPMPAPAAAPSAPSKPSSPNTNEFSSNSDQGSSDLSNSDDLFSGTSGDDDFGLDNFDDDDESYSDFLPSKPSKFAFAKKQETPKLVIRSNTRSDSGSSSGDVETDLQRIAVVLLSKKNTQIFAKAMAVVVLLLVSAGLWSDYSKLGVASASSNPNELRSYLNSQFTYIWDTDIRLRLSDMESSTYEQAKTTGDIADYKRYLRDFPNGRYFDEVLDSIGPINQSGEVK